MNQPRPCPFCGSDRVMCRDSISVAYVVCLACRAHGPWVYQGDNKDMLDVQNRAIEQWNKQSTGETKNPENPRTWIDFCSIIDDLVQEIHSSKITE